jgi:hemerythrin-like domain-containing protein
MILNLLKEDHREVDDLLEQIVDTTARAAKKRQQLFEQVKTALLAHSHAELELFYKPLLEKGEDPDALLEAEVEHQVVERLLMDIEQTDPSDEKWLAKVTVLQELVQHHVKEEEKEIFKLAREAFEKDELEQIGQDFEARKEQEIAAA